MLPPASPLYFVCDTLSHMTQNHIYHPYILVIVGTICWYALGILVDSNSQSIQDFFESAIMLAAWTAVPFFLGYFFTRTYWSLSLKQSAGAPTLPSSLRLFLFAFFVSFTTPLLFTVGAALIFHQPVQVNMPGLFLLFMVVSNSIFAGFFLWGIRYRQKNHLKKKI